MIGWARRFVRQHPARAATIGAVGAGLFVFGMVWFEPHKLFIDERVDEAVPMAVTASPTTSPVPPEMEPEGPAILARGGFRSLEHETTGLAKIVSLPDGRRFLRFEQLDTSNGPDLRVYLSEIPASDDWHAYGVRFLDLGDLKANQGNQNYEIPRDADLDRYVSAVIWCRRFEVGFGVAPLR